jgi:hypothetical protein
MAEKTETTLFEKAVWQAGAGVIFLEEACKFRDQPGHLLEMCERRPSLFVPAIRTKRSSLATTESFSMVTGLQSLWQRCDPQQT